MVSPLADIVFDCPLCHQPVIVEKALAGVAVSCPHCAEVIEAPADVPAVNKEIFLEPPNLRRVLSEVRDREWEEMRRKLRDSQQKVRALEAGLANKVEHHSAPDAPHGGPHPASTEVESLQRQLAESHGRFVLANQAFSAGRKQHEMALDRLRRDFETTREESLHLRKKHDENVATAANATAEAEKLRKKAIADTEKIAGLEAELEFAKGEVADLSRKASETAADLEREREKTKAQAQERNDGEEDAADPADAAEKKDGEPDAPAETAPGSHRLRSQIAALQKTNAAIRAARDRALDEAEQLKKKVSARDHEDENLESSLTELETVIKEVVWTLSSRREDKSASS